jgi:hypothetical protein
MKHQIFLMTAICSLFSHLICSMEADRPNICLSPRSTDLLLTEIKRKNIWCSELVNAGVEVFRKSEKDQNCYDVGIRGLKQIFFEEPLTPEMVSMMVEWIVVERFSKEELDALGVRVPNKP